MNRRFLFVCLGILVLSNVQLFWAPGSAHVLAFDIAAVQAGEVWRILTFPLAHRSWYHLLVDALPLFLLLGLVPSCHRLGAVLAASFGSLLLPLVIAKDLAWLGLAGLSGAVYGVLALVTLRLAFRGDTHVLRLVGLGLFIGTLGKCGWEIIFQTEELFAAFNIGSVGVPVEESHLGGVLGALAYAFVDRTTFFRSRPAPDQSSSAHGTPSLNCH